MQATGGNPDFGAETELPAIGKLARGIVHHDRAVGAQDEPFRYICIFGDDHVGMVRAMLGNMRQRLVDTIDHADRKDGGQIFGIPVGRIGGNHSLVQLQHRIVAAYFATGFQQRANKRSGRGIVLIDQQGLHRSADAGPPHLGVDRDRQRLVGVGVLGDIGMTNAVEMRENRHPRLVLDPLDQRLAAARNDDVDQSAGLQHRPDRSPVGGLDQLDGVGRQARLDHARDHRLVNRAVALNRFRTAAQDHGIARTQRQSSRIRGHIGTAFIDDADHAERDPDALHHKAVGSFGAINDLSDRIGKFAHMLDGRGNRFKPFRVDHQPVEH